MDSNRAWRLLSPVWYAAVVCCVVTGECSAGDLRFLDRMKELRLSDPGYAWHGYHDAIVCADWDADGDVDILVVVSLHEKGPLGRQARLYVNRLAEAGKLAFEDKTEALMPDGIQKKVLADSSPFFFDLDADGDLDLCVVSDESRPVTFINDHGVFRLQKWGFRAQHCKVADFDGDGDLDVLGKDTGLLYVNDGKGKYASRRYGLEPRGHIPRDKRLPTPNGIQVDEEVKKLAAAKGHVYYSWFRRDVNGDGRSDYHLRLSKAYGCKLARFYAFTDHGYRDITDRTRLPTDALITLVDVTGDGRLDAVATGKRAGGIFLGDGTGRFRRAAASDADTVFKNTIGGCYTIPQRVADLDCDGIPDIVTRQPRIGRGNGVLQGLGQGRFERILQTNASSGQAVADIDNDGLLDVIASGNKRTRGLHVWVNVTVDPGRWLAVRLKGPKANPFAAGTVVEAYPPGKLGDPKARLARGEAAADGLPVHLGLRRHETVDLKVILPSGKVRTVTAVGTNVRREISALQ